MTSPPMRFENGLETQPPLSAHTRTADADVVNSDTYNTDLKLVFAESRAGLGDLFAKLKEMRRKDHLNPNKNCSPSI